MKKVAYLTLLIVMTTGLASFAAAFDISGVWKHGNSGETWTFSTASDGTYKAVENGFGNARGAAVLVGSRLLIVYATQDKSITGLYDLQLSSDGQRADGTYQDSRPAGGPAHLARITQKCSVAGTWRNGDGTWTFTRQSDGRFKAQERGYGNASGTAVQMGNNVRLDYVTADQRVKGYYEFILSDDCKKATGEWGDDRPVSGTFSMDRIK